MLCTMWQATREEMAGFVIPLKYLANTSQFAYKQKLINKGLGSIFVVDFTYNNHAYS